MKTSAIRKLRRQLAADRPAVGMWVTLEAPSITEMAVGLGVDWVLIDAEHGHLDWNDICATSGPPFAATPWPWSGWPN